MKIMAYTRDKNVYNEKASKNLKVVSEKEWQKTRFFVKSKYTSKANFFKWGKKYVPNQFILGHILAKKFKKIGSKNILSVGTGDGYIEYTIKKRLPSIKLVVSDFDGVLISNLKKVIPEVGKFCVIDIKKDTFDRYVNDIDTLMMVAVFYVLSDKEAVSLFTKLSKTKINNIIIVAIAYLWPEDILRYIIANYLGGAYIGKVKNFLIGKKVIPKPPGRFHGWTRSKGEFEKILQKEGSFKIKVVERFRDKFHDSAIIHLLRKNPIPNN